MKLLITNTQGRSGTTLLQSVLAHVYKLDNLGEYIDYNDKVVYNSTTKYLLDHNNWCCKMFFDTEFNDYYQPVEFIKQLQPDAVVNSFRKDLFDQYLSLQVSMYNKSWNSNSKLTYKSFTIDNVDDSIQEFLENIQRYTEQLNTIRKHIPVYDVSYEDLIDNTVNIFETVDVDTATKEIDMLTVKQNSKQDKFKLIKNIEQVKTQWRTINDRT